jgi:hypothetical protein
MINTFKNYHTSSHQIYLHEDEKLVQFSIANNHS